MVKKTLLLIPLMSLLLNGCVSRTVSSEPALVDLQKGLGYNASDRVVKKKLVWIWQDEYRNPK